MYKFPYDACKDILVKGMERELDEHKQGLGKHAERILDFHLRADTQAMPCMNHQEYENVLNAFELNEKLDEIRDRLKLEDASTEKGMFRVLVRTHLNRSGMNNISQGFPENKTLSPRILGFTDSIPLNENVSARKLIKAWIEYANNFSEHQCNDPGLCYNENALRSLRRLGVIAESRFRDLDSGALTPHMLNKAYNGGADGNVSGFKNWCRIYLGILSGLSYLQKLRWDIYRRATATHLTSEDVLDMIKEIKTNVIEYGVALAGSYLADMGGTEFVKDDVHVRRFATAFDASLNTPLERVQFVMNQARENGTFPRALDKLMYIAGSGNFPLLGLRLCSASWKDEFERVVRESGPA